MRGRMSGARCMLLRMRNGMFVCLFAVLTSATFFPCCGSLFACLTSTLILFTVFTSTSHSLYLFPHLPQYQNTNIPLSSYACGPCRPAVEAPWMEALKIPILTQRRLSRVWRQQPPPRPVWKNPSSIKCPPSMKWADHRRTILTPLHQQHSHHRHHSPALVA